MLQITAGKIFKGSVSARREPELEKFTRHS